MKNEKIQKKPYAKPSSVDLGKVAPVLGETCSYGNGADTFCRTGNGNSNACGTGLSAGGFGCGVGNAV